MSLALRTRVVARLAALALLAGTALGVTAVSPAHAAGNGTVTFTVSSTTERPVLSGSVQLATWNGTEFEYGTSVPFGQGETAIEVTLPEGTHFATYHPHGMSGNLPDSYGSDIYDQPTAPGQPGTFVVTAGGSVTVPFTYGRVVALTGTTTDAAGPVLRAYVVLVRWNRNAQAFYTVEEHWTNWRGRYEFGAVGPGRYSMLFYPDGDPPVRPGPTGRAGEPTRFWLGGGEMPTGPDSPGVFTVSTADLVKNVRFDGPSPAPVATTAPSIPSTAAVGATVTVDPGTWTETPAFAYQWTRNGAPIAGATATTYAVTAADAGTDLAAVVTATQHGNLPGTATSNTAAVPAAPAAGPAPVPAAAKVASTTTAQAKKAKPGKKVKVTITVTAPGSTPTGTVTIGPGRARPNSLTLKNGSAKVRLKLKPGKHRLHVKYLGNDTVLPSAARVVVKIKRGPRR